MAVAVVSVAGIFPAIGVSAQTPNVISNPSVETADSTSQSPSNWSKNRWGSNSASFTYVSGEGYTGLQSMRVNMTQQSSGDAKWYFSHVSVKPNQKYNFTNYYKSNTATEVVIEYKKTSEALSYSWLLTSAASSLWKQNQHSFTTPSDAKSLTIYHLINKVGWLQTDDFSLMEEDPEAPSPPPATPPAAPQNPVNLYSNGSFETTGGTTPTGWIGVKWGSNTGSLSYHNSGHSGSKSVKAEISSYSSGALNWYHPTVSVTGGKTYSFENWYQSNADTQIDAQVVMSDGSTVYHWVTTLEASSGWSKSKATFTAPAGAKSISLYHLLAKPGYLITDDYSLSEYQPGRFNRVLVSLTFDDGWRSIYSNGLPLLNKYGFVSTQYLLSGTTTYSDYMTVSMMNSFKDQGSEIAAHTVDHPDLTTLNTSQLHYQLSQCKLDLQLWTGVNVSNFASPFGAYNNNTVSAIKQYYGSHRSVEAGYNTKDSFNVYNVKVQNILNTTTVSDVERWVNQAIQDNSWLVLVYHRVENTTETYTVTPSNLDGQLGLIKQKGVAVVTVNQAINEINTQL